MEQIKVVPRKQNQTGHKEVLITKEHIRKLFHKNLPSAAKELGICQTALKNVCKKFGMGHWPYRKLKAINSSLKVDADTHAENHQLKQQILDGSVSYFSYNSRTRKECPGCYIDKWLNTHPPEPPRPLPMHPITTEPPQPVPIYPILTEPLRPIPIYPMQIEARPYAPSTYSGEV